MTWKRVVGVALIAIFIAVGIAALRNDEDSPSEKRGLSGSPIDRPLRLDQMTFPSLAPDDVIGECYARGPAVGALGLPGIPGEAAIGPVDGLRRASIYLALAGAPRVVQLPASEDPNDFEVIDALWVSRPKYDGPIVVRGRRLDGQGALLFGDDGLDVLRLPPGEWPSEDVPRRPGEDVPPRWRVTAVSMGVRDRGCYAVQIDGEDFSYVLHFAVGFR